MTKCIYYKEKQVVADICLYNNYRKMFAICDVFDESFDNPIGYICDWENKREFTLQELIASKFSE